MEFFDAVKNRISVRDYSEEDVKKSHIERIIDAGRLAATARNEQPWAFVAAHDPSTLTKIAALCPNGSFLQNAKWLIAVFSADTKYYIEDCSAATQNMLLAAAALGLGACWIAGDKKDYVSRVGETLGAPQNYRLVSMLSIGRPSSAPVAKQKKGLGELVHWENWKAS